MSCFRKLTPCPMGGSIRHDRIDRRSRSHRHRPLLVRPAPDGSRLAMPRDDPHALVDPFDDVVRGAGLQESDAATAAGTKDAVACLLHLLWIGFARNRAVAQR